MASNEMPSSSSSSLVKKSVEDVGNKYEITRLLGDGLTSKVYEGTHKKTGISVAIKCISSEFLKIHSHPLQRNALDLKNEIMVFQIVEHPNIVRLIEIFDNPTQVCLVMELMAGGDLFDRIIDKNHYAEKDASFVIYQILDAVAYLHDAGIIHRDLKLENILYETPAEDSKIMLTDFGLSSIGVVGQTLTRTCGSRQYMALEIVDEKAYGKEVDVWAIGVITYMLLFGDSPFYEWEDAEDFRINLELNFDFNSSDWDHISDAAKHFIGKLVVRDPKERYSCRQAMTDPWICSGAAGSKNIQESVSTNMKKFMKKFVRNKCKQAFNVSSAAVSRLCEMTSGTSTKSP